MQRLRGAGVVSHARPAQHRAPLRLSESRSGGNYDDDVARIFTHNGELLGAVGGYTLEKAQ